MNEFIFLTDTIGNVGGSQLYTSHKVDWLESLGWKVNVFYERISGDVVLDNLKRFEKNWLPALSVPFAMASGKTRERNAKRVVPRTSADKVIIECHLPNYCFWGEYFGNLCGGMTICYPLSEGMAKMKKEELDFFSHKLKQNLLFGISDKSIPLMLGKSASTEHRGLLAVGAGSNLSDEDYAMPLVEHAKTILAIGRLEKPYVPNMVSSIKRFLGRHKESNFNIILLGDSPDKTTRESIVSSLSECPNSNVFCTGYLNPIPKSIFKKCDVAIGSAGCVEVAARQGGVLTISVDSFDHMAIGVYGITTNETLFRKDEKPQDIDALLEEILIENKYSGKDVEFPVIVSDYSKHEEIINRYVPNVPYQMHFTLTAKDKIKRVLISLVGCEIYVKYFTQVPLYMKLKKILSNG